MNSTSYPSLATQGRNNYLVKMERSPCIIPSLKYSNEGNHTVISSFIKKNNVDALNANAFTSEHFSEMLKCEVYKMFSDVELELQPNA